MPIVEAALEAARVRLRPILMTSFAFILGVVPLMIASGAGAASKGAVGTTVFGGMIAATVLTALAVPAFYVLIQGIAERFGRRPRGGDRGRTARRAGCAVVTRAALQRGGRRRAGRDRALLARLRDRPGLRATGRRRCRGRGIPRACSTPQQAESYADLGWATTFNDPELLEMIRTALESQPRSADRRGARRGVPRAARESRAAGLGPQMRGTGSTSPIQPGRRGRRLTRRPVAQLGTRPVRPAAPRERSGARPAARLGGQRPRRDDDAGGRRREPRGSSCASSTRKCRSSATPSRASRNRSPWCEALNRSGVASGTEEQQAIGQLATTRAQLPVAERSREQTENRLRFLLGYPPDRIPRIQSPRAFPVPERDPGRAAVPAARAASGSAPAREPAARSDRARRCRARVPVPVPRASGSPRSSGW